MALVANYGSDSEDESMDVEEEEEEEVQVPEKPKLQEEAKAEANVEDKVEDDIEDLDEDFVGNANGVGSILDEANEDIPGKRSVLQGDTLHWHGCLSFRALVVIQLVLRP